MKRFHRNFPIFATVLSTIAGAAYAQQPPDIVQSDSHQNTAMGGGALSSNVDYDTSGNNTAAGFDALFGNTIGPFNSAFGSFALASNVSGPGNVAVGYGALSGNTSGGGNTAVGFEALQQSISGGNNTATGTQALQTNTTGSLNVADGTGVLEKNTTGSNNTADGPNAMFFNETGSLNTATGNNALFLNTTGNSNTVSGDSAAYRNTSGSGNVALGESALYLNRTGGNNIALGAFAGYNIFEGYRNIDIGNVGANLDAGTIRIGTAGEHFATYIAGISNVHLTGSAVYVSSSGQLGVLASSERYKTAIEPMAQRTEKLNQLRPVTFHLKTDPKGDVQYGLIAEEVAKVYPELVIRDEQGQIQGVRYEELAPMLLNEMQKQSARLAQLDDLKREVAELKRSNEQLQAIVGRHAKDEQLAQR